MIIPDSSNIAVVPINPMGAVELGLSPCHYCQMGWGSCSISSEGVAHSESCHDTCQYFKMWKPSLRWNLKLNEGITIINSTVRI